MLYSAGYFFMFNYLLMRFEFGLWVSVFGLCVCGYFLLFVFVCVLLAG